MTNIVNLNQSRINTLTSRVEAIDNFVKGDDVFSKLYESTVSQGSYAHKTIIKPSDKKQEFDADLVFYITEKDDWEPKDYIEELYKRFKSSGVYKDKCSRGTRCVTIDYSGEFHLDVVPCIYRKSVFSNTYHICNKYENEEERTDPQGYTDWIADKNSSVGANNLIKVIRLLKYLRDIKQTFSCKSILLTTLVANQVGGLEDLLSPYKDLPTSLKVLVNRLNDYLQYHETMPIVTNPVNDEEDFNRHWNQEKYNNFRNQIERYNEWINDAFNESVQKESIEKWQKVFGGDFGSSVVATQSINKSEAQSVSNNYPIPAYVEKLKWPFLGTKNLPIKVTIHKSNDGGPAIAEMQKEIIGNPVGKHLKVRMECLAGVASTHELHWQIVNTGLDAINNRCPRGNIFYGGEVRWEDTLYKGIHWVECFLVDSKKKVCTSRSGRYFVNIG